MLVLNRSPADAAGAVLLRCCAVQSVQHNGSLYTHVVFTRSGVNLDAPEDEIPPDSVFTTTASAFMVVQMYRLSAGCVGSPAFFGRAAAAVLLSLQQGWSWVVLLSSQAAVGTCSSLHSQQPPLCFTGWQLDGRAVMGVVEQWCGGAVVSTAACSGCFRQVHAGI